MRRTTTVVAVVLGILLAATVTSVQGKGSRPVPGPATTSTKLPSFDLGISDSEMVSGAAAPLAVSRSHEVGVRYARVNINWARVAPRGETMPTGFDPRNPADPRYDWRGVDASVKSLTAAGFTVYLCLLSAPSWAEGGIAPDDSGATPGSWRPSAAAFGDFAHAAAARYNGTFAAPLTGALLPRVSIWQAWNEPNLPMFFAPTSADRYRSLLNAMYDEVKAVQPDAIVVTAGLAPVKSSEPAAFPKEFALRLLCLKHSGGWFKRDRSCRERAKFDVFSVHPYSLRAGPTQRAAVNGNMFVADVIDVTQMVRAATRARTVYPAARKRLWSTEFAWFTNPPNKSTGDPPELAATRTLTALHELWSAGVSHVTWFAISDDAPALIQGGGFYYADGNPKPTRDALRFPFFASQRRHTAYVWGSAPRDAASLVTIQRRTKRGYRTVLKLRPRADGLFSVRFRVSNSRRGSYRALQPGAGSLTMRAAPFVD